ncbi:MAG TPA: DUF4926 domain-containing protein [Anaerolineae bacterium]|jgi:hypothetical protein|nr:DUF4926 domain-containing protein [Ardenticatenia bacterium]MBK8540773.1 DUF4926 domain-containing protein [Ardenticatenia bacterium]HQZ71774.1 DUF4926 domain-containing protein [Anaerolineae bacterium]HRA20555.1 DUF4926 domain-containing protein [Anaerolineae bacterium]
MITELDTVVLTRSIPEDGLLAGDLGAVVHVYANMEACEVEFVTGTGHTLAVLTLPMDAVRPLQDAEILHARPLVAA